MEDQDIQKEELIQKDTLWRNIEKSHRRGKIMGGLLVVTIGSLFLARELGVEIPFWVFTWKMLLIGLGLIIAVKHKFLHPAWIILVAVGGAFLLNDIYPTMQIKPILWPSLVILLGLVIIFKPRRKRHFGRYRRHWKKWHGHHHMENRRNFEHQYRDFDNREELTKDNFIESMAFMAGVKKNVLSKEFKGAEITNVFGGTELNLSQADLQGTANLEITQVFGGTKLVVPANWEIRSSDLVTVFGSVEDKRATQPGVNGEAVKILILTGVTFFGGIEIRSF